MASNAQVIELNDYSFVVQLTAARLYDLGQKQGKTAFDMGAT